ncbi:hypothetical protein KP509_27G020000 [Ceratopteris richardii]|uniref:Uncharacterized protein n=1 Tax=Ceratopteris richardii TaxID=49495 RepID=A0A8T2REG8_CERRI|nr:hypothetical protein KP509_27G020000 [Ceratopteris richardii]
MPSAEDVIRMVSAERLVSGRVDSKDFSETVKSSKSGRTEQQEQKDKQTTGDGSSVSMMSIVRGINEGVNVKCECQTGTARYNGHESVKPVHGLVARLRMEDQHVLEDVCMDACRYAACMHHFCRCTGRAVLKPPVGGRRLQHYHRESSNKASDVTFPEDGDHRCQHACLPPYPSRANHLEDLLDVCKNEDDTCQHPHDDDHHHHNYRRRSGSHGSAVNGALVTSVATLRPSTPSPLGMLTRSWSSAASGVSWSPGSCIARTISSTL